MQQFSVTEPVTLAPEVLNIKDVFIRAPRLVYILGCRTIKQHSVERKRHRGIVPTWWLWWFLWSLGGGHPSKKSKHHHNSHWQILQNWEGGHANFFFISVFEILIRFTRPGAKQFFCWKASVSWMFIGGNRWLAVFTLEVGGGGKVHLEVHLLDNFDFWLFDIVQIKRRFWVKTMISCLLI